MVGPRKNVTSLLRYRALRELGNRLRLARIEAGLTQAQAADRLGISAQTIRNWEAGRHEPGPSALSDLSVLYEVGSAELSEILRVIEATPEPALRYDRIPVDPDKLRESRIRSGHTQAEAAAQIGLSENSIGRYENGQARPSFGNLMKLAELYDEHAYEFIAEGHEAEVAYLFRDRLVQEPRYRPPPDKAERAYELAKADLSDEAVTIIAEFIRYIRQRELAQHNESRTKQ